MELAVKPFLITLLFSPIAALARAPDQFPAKTPIVITKPFLYKVTRGPAEHYVLGTQHIEVPLAALPPRVADLVKKANVLMVESREDWATNGFVSFLALKYMFRWSGPKLWESLSPEAFRELQTEFGEAGADLKMLDALTPMGAMMTLMAGHAGQAGGGRLDHEIIVLARKAHVPVNALDSLATTKRSLAAFRMSDATLDELLVRAARERTEGKPTVDIEGLYAAGEEGPLWAEIIHQMKDSGFPIGTLLDRRNQTWVERIAKLPPQKHAFVAVGVAHLFGENGLLALLGQKGFTVERM